MEDARGKAKPHALFVPMPFQGHFTPSANLAIKFAAKGFTVTFVNTEAFHHQRLAAGVGSGDDVFDAARSEGLDIRYDLVSDGLPVSLDRNVHIEQFSYAIRHLLGGHVEQLMRKLSLIAETRVNVLIADSFFSWPSTLAKKFGVPYVSFWTEPALVFSVYCHMPLLVDNGHLGSPNERRKDAITYIPGVRAIDLADLPSFLQPPETPFSSLSLRNIGEAIENMKGADFVLCNTVQELETDVIVALQREWRFYAVGPITNPDLTLARTNVWPESDCLPWLDAMPPRSVLYISFGSIAPVSKRDMEEIAHGISSSDANFLWAVHPGSSFCAEADGDQLPAGFADANSGRGLVVPWCRQIEVLRHPAVGGFLTHCGWNSILESIWFGVPMLCFPLFSDQLTNRKLVVKDTRVGIDIGDVGEVSRAQVSSAINGVLGGRIGAELRRAMGEARKTVRSAASSHGSSCQNWDRFTVELLRLLSKQRISQWERERDGVDEI